MDHVTPATTSPTLKHPPKTAGLPLIGSIPNVLKQQINFLEQARETHGDVYKLDLGMLKILIFNHPDHAQYILRDNARNYRKGGAMWDSVRSLLGNGLVVSEGDFWLRQRRMMQPHFHRQHLGALTELMVSAIEDGMDGWDAVAESGEPFDIVQAFSEVTMKIIMKTTFGGNLSDSDVDEMSKEMTYALDYMLPNMLVGSLPDWLPVPGRQRYHRAIEKIDSFIYRVIEERRQQGETVGDVLSMLLQMVDEETNDEMTNQQIRDEAVTLFVAGYETTALTLSWCVYNLMQNPAMFERLCAEVDDVLQGQPPTFDSLMKLTYTRMVLQEGMRLYPPAFWIPRTAIDEDEIDGYHIAAGQPVGVAVYGIHHHPRVWENPDVFDPERFSPARAEGRHPFAWIPFGAGQRLCLGRDFAMMEGAFVLATLAQRYRLKATDHVAKPMLSSTLRPKNGVHVGLEKR